MNITLGQIVFSKAGRDSGRKFVIVGVINESNVTVSDGDIRKIEKPKKKKIKHLELTINIVDSLRLKLDSKQKVSNSEIRKSLSE